MTRDNQANDDNLEQRLIALGNSVPASDRLTRSVMDKIEHEMPATSQSMRGHTNFGRWIMRGSIGLAACTLIGAFLWSVLLTPPQAYGIEDMREQLGKAKSLYMAGKSSDGVAFEIYAERPNRSYRVQDGHRIIQTAEKYMVINDQDKTAILAPGDPLDARFLVETVMQTEAFNQLLGPPGEKMNKIRSERIADVEVDVYENTRDPKDNGKGEGWVRREVYLNPKTGLPVKTALYVTTDSVEVALATIDRIEANGLAPKGAFDFVTPKGYELREMPAVKGELRRPPAVLTSVHGDHLHLEVGYTLNLNNKAILLCWSFYDDRKPGEDLKLPAAGTLSIEGPKGKYFEHLVRADEGSDKRHWRWSLLVPQDAAVNVADNVPSVKVTAKSVLSFTQAPVTFTRDEMKQFILDAQKRTLAEGEKPLTLEEFEAKLKEASEKAL